MGLPSSHADLENSTFPTTEWYLCSLLLQGSGRSSGLQASRTCQWWHGHLLTYPLLGLPRHALSWLPSSHIHFCPLPLSPFCSPQGRLLLPKFKALFCAPLPSLHLVLHFQSLNDPECSGFPISILRLHLSSKFSSCIWNHPDWVLLSTPPFLSLLVAAPSLQTQNVGPLTLPPCGFLISSEFLSSIQNILLDSPYPHFSGSPGGLGSRQPSSHSLPPSLANCHPLNTILGRPSLCSGSYKGHDIPGPHCSAPSLKALMLAPALLPIASALSHALAWSLPHSA